MKYLSVKHRFFKNMLTTPIIYFALVPILILDIYIEIYHRFCFPFYSIPYVKRKNYIKIDRHKLSYLNPAQRISCLYCGYANGVIHYWSKIIGETEKYWCGIQHEQNESFIPPSHHAEFIKYDDNEAFNEKYNKNKTKMF